MTFEACLRKIEDFARLEAGWHYGEGVPMTPEASSAAVSLAQVLFRRSIETGVFPDPNGGIMFTIYIGSANLDIKIDDEGFMSITMDVPELLEFLRTFSEENDVKITPKNTSSRDSRN